MADFSEHGNQNRYTTDGHDRLDPAHPPVTEWCVKCAKHGHSPGIVDEASARRRLTAAIKEGCHDAALATRTITYTPWVLIAARAA